MYGLNKNEDLDFLLGKKLEQVAIGLYQVILNFKDNVSISIEDKFGIKFPNIKSLESSEETYAIVGAKLIALLGERIEKVENQGNGSLSLTFSQGTTLVLHDTKPNYQAYQLTDSDNDIIV